MSNRVPTRAFFPGILLVTGWLCLGLPLQVAGQMPPEQQAKMLLDSAKRAYNEKNYPFARDRFREFVQRFGNLRDADQARFGLALCMLEGPERDFDRALEALQPLLGQKAFPDYAGAHYRAGLARRGQGLKALETPATQPQAKARFEESARHFATAAEAYLERARTAAPGGVAALADREAGQKARCEQAEMLLRAGQPRPASEAVALFASDKDWQNSRSLSQGLYCLGVARFLLDDFPGAGKVLGRKDILENDIFGTHARYLLARVYHQNQRQNEREEARIAYQDVLKEHEAGKKKAQERLNQPADPETRQRLERLARGPDPEHVVKARYYLGMLQVEDGRHGEALDHFKAFLASNPPKAIAAEAQLQTGVCLAEMKQSDEAIRVLQPLADTNPDLADQALYYLARAQLGKADEKKPETVRPALETFRRAAERAGQRATANPPDPRARQRRGEILMDLGEACLRAGLPRDAAAPYTTVIQEKLLPEREDEATLQLAVAQQLDGNLDECEKTCATFRERFRDSPLLPGLLFRQADNATLLGLRAEKAPNPADRLRESTRHNDEAIRRYQALLKQFPDFSRAHAARYGLGLAHFRKGEQDLAAKTLEAIPAADRVGDLVGVHYDLAGIYLRQLPTRADDAVAAGKLEEKLKSASEMLESYLAAAPESPHAPDALLKLGFCQHRIGGLLANPEEKQKALANARASLDKIQPKNREHPAFAAATMERAKVMVSQKDVDGGIRELQRFVAEEPLKKSAIAPMALVQLASLLRSRNRAAEAVTVLAECRKNYEAALAGDPERAGWAVRLPFHHAQALRETGKLVEAQQLFEQAARSERPEGWEAGLRAELARREAGTLKLAEAAKLLQQPGQKPEQIASLEKLHAEGLEMLRQSAQQLASREKTLRDRKVDGEELQRELVQTRARMLYESAWTWRMVADQELDAARRKREKERVEKRREELARMLPPGQTPPAVPVPEIPLQELPVQPAEEQAKARYEEMIQALADQPLTMEARFELAEMLSRRHRHDEAVKLLQATLEGEKEPSPELAEKIRLRLASSLLERGAARKGSPGKPAPEVAEQARKDIAAALEQLQPITANEKSLLLGQALYREGECQLHLDQLDEAIKKLSRFRDQQPLQNLPGLSDRALLRLGWALGEKAQWDASRVAYEALLQRFPSSPWRHEARYGIAWSMQKQGRLDEAVNQYAQVTSAVANEMGARAQLNIGQCRLAQKRYNEASTALLVVPFTYDYPELNALALVEAARSLLEDKQKDQAVRLLRRVLRDHAGSAQADAARKKLLELGEGVEG